jgi:hypothetical protein
MSSPDPIRSILELIGSKILGRERPTTEMPVMPSMRAVPPMQNMGDAILEPFGLSGPKSLDMLRPRTPGTMVTQRILEDLGFLPQQRSGEYNLNQSLGMYNAVAPMGTAYYGKDPISRAGSIMQAVDEFKRNPKPRNITDEYHSKAQEDAWAIWLGLPQPFGSFDVSPYKPSRSTNRNQIYLRLPSLWSALANTPLDRDPLAFGLDTAEFRSRSRAANDLRVNSNGIRNMLNYIGDKDKVIVSGDDLATSDLKPGAALANFTLARGQDDRGHYISYYDIWDLHTPGAGSRIGRDFEIYDRLYYNPKTLEPIDQPQPSRVRGRGHPGMPRRR